MGRSQKLDYPIAADAALEPPSEWEELRQGCPVAEVRLPSGDTASLLTRYDDVKQILADSRFSRRLDAPGAARMAANESGGVFNRPSSNGIPEGGDGHRRWRRAVGKWFTTRRMMEMRPGMESMANGLIDDMVAGGEPADLRAALAFPFPVWVICRMLGVPDSDRDSFSHWSDTLLSLTRYTQREIDESQRAFTAYMADHVARKRRDPGDDILSALITDETPMPDEALVSTGRGLLVAGHETTANMIGKMVAMLLSHRERWERLLADRSLVHSTVEEALRFDANQGFGIPRYITEPTEVSGTTVEAGTTVVCSMAAANRDDTVFDTPDTMDLTRGPNPHLTFGVGSHSCLGQALARIELRVVLEVLLDRLPTLDLAVDPTELHTLDGLAVGGLREVPVRW